MQNDQANQLGGALSDKPTEEPGLESHPLLFQDELTGLYNRRYYNRAYADHTLAATEHGTPLGLLLLDVDYFKTINDRYGHHNGDLLLTEIGHRINQSVASDGLPIRYAGDEFVVILPEADLARTEEVAARIVASARERPFDLTDRTVEVTLSVGVAHFPTDVADPRELFEAADRAAYLAKKAGRNQSARWRPVERREIDAANLHNYFPCETFVGREERVLALLGALTTAAGKRRPWAVVSGDAGIGKTRLLQELARRMDEQRHFLLETVGLPHLQTQPYAMLLGPISLALRHSPQVLSRVAAALSPPQIDAIVGLLPEFRRYAGDSGATSRSPAGGSGATSRSGPDRRVEATPQEHVAEAQRTALATIVRTLAKGRIAVLLADDVHLADPQSVDVLAELRAHDEQTFVCLCVGSDGEKSAGPELRGLLQALREERSTMVVQVEPLTADEVADMVDAILPGARDIQVLGPFVHARSQGRPLLVEETLKLLIQRGAVKYEDALLRVGDLDAAAIPRDARALLNARAEQADAEVRGLMSRAAVIGTYFDLGTLMQIEGDKNEGWLTAVLERARKASIIEEEWTGVHTRYSFASTQMHVSFYHMAPREERIEVERRLRDYRAQQKALRAAVTASTVRPAPSLSRVAAVDAFRGVAVVGLLAGGAVGSSMAVHPGDLFLPWLLLGIGIGVPFAWRMHRSRPISPHQFFERAMGTMLLMLALGTVTDLVGFTRVGPWSYGAGALQLLGVGYYVAAFLVDEGEGARAIGGLVLLTVYGGMLRYNVFDHLGKLPQWHLQWLPLLVPAIATALIGSSVGSLLAAERRAINWILVRLVGGGLVCMGLGWLGAMVVPFNAHLLSPSFTLVAIGSGLMVFSLCEIMLESLGLGLVLLPLEVLGLKALVGVGIFAVVSTVLQRISLTPATMQWVDIAWPALFAIGWMAIQFSNHPRRRGRERRGRR